MWSALHVFLTLRPRRQLGAPAPHGARAGSSSTRATLPWVLSSHSRTLTGPSFPFKTCFLDVIPHETPLTPPHASWAGMVQLKAFLKATKHLWSGIYATRNWKQISKRCLLVYFTENKGGFREGYTGYRERHSMGRAEPQSQYWTVIDRHLLMRFAQHWREAQWFLCKRERQSKAAPFIFILEATHTCTQQAVNSDC